MSNLPPPTQPPEPEPERPYSPPPPPQPQAHAAQAATGWATLGNGQQVELASPGARLGARVVDAVLMFAFVIFIFLVFLGGLGSANDRGDAGIALGGVLLFPFVFALVGAIYEVVLIATKGQTVGKMAANVKVIRADNGGTVGAGKSIGRWIVPAVLGVIPFFGLLLSLLVYVSLTWDRARQGWHDKAAGTIVITT